MRMVCLGQKSVIVLGNESPTLAHQEIQVGAFIGL
jgi:hypothetical protein